MKSLVSILIPAFNAEEWIAGCLTSAVGQTWPRKEIIVVDDGSSDKTVAIARQFESEGVRVVTGPNRGAAAARNRAFSLCHGDYIQWLDADDLLAPDKISVQMEMLDLIKSKRTLLSSAWGRFLYRSNRAKFVPSPLWCDLTPEEWLLRKMSLNVYMQTATWLVSRELTEAAGEWNMALLGDDDGEYFCRVLMASDGVRFAPESKVYHRSFGYDTLSYVGRSPKRRAAHWLSMRMHVNYLRSFDDSPRARAACITYLQSCLVYFYPENLEIVEEARQVARELGGKLEDPVLPRKYRWAKAIFGWGVAMRISRSMRRMRWWGKQNWDKMLFIAENRISPSSRTHGRNT
jgi:glycosyltransferase involved in cell wall biosynthesis